MSTEQRKTPKPTELTILAVTATDRTELKNAKLVFEYAKKSVNSIYEIYQKERYGSSGSTTHEEQDLLRAILVFSCSGLDAVVKQLIKDALPNIIEHDQGAEQQFQKYVERRLRKGSLDEKDKSLALDTVLLAEVLVSKAPKILLSQRLIEHLTDDSLQNRDQLLKVASYFAITRDQVLDDGDLTKTAFDVRNEIVHAMDVNLKASGAGKKKRYQRSREDMVGYSENVLSIAARFINVVAAKLK